MQVQPKVQIQPGSVLQSSGIAPRIVLASNYGMQFIFVVTVAKKHHLTTIFVFFLALLLLVGMRVNMNKTKVMISGERQKVTQNVSSGTGSPGLSRTNSTEP